MTHTAAELVELQLQALEVWNRARAAAERAAAVTTASREVRMDLDRRMDVLRAQQAAIVEHTEQQLRASVRLLHADLPRRAVVAHRNEWFVQKVCGDLEACGVEVVARLENGAEAVGIAVAEQPDLVIVEDRLAMLSGEDVVRDVRRYAPRALIAAQVAYEDRVAPMLEAGADTAYTRRVPPLDLSADVHRLLDLERQPA